MRVGCCVSDLARLDVADRAGADYAELPVASWVMGAAASDMAALDGRRLRPLAANVLLPSDLRLVGPGADPGRIDAYVADAIGRLARLGVRILVFGGGASRAIPEGLSRADALDDLERFLQKAGARARDAGMTLVLEPLRSAETNVWTSVREAGAFLRERDLRCVRLLADLYHMREDGEGMDAIAEFGDLLAHVHVAGPDRRPPRADSELRAFLDTLQAAGYTGDCSIECRWEDFAAEVGPAVEAVRAAAWGE
ncbi:MAG: sugar phosphate isomerase/epimerase [bacterium]|jgi:sugar phosphate isomerase/epimerase|nr:sugar phosphate isomerase/epimerase [bacterium]